MADNQRFLDLFPTWIKSLGSDVNELAALVRDGSLDETPRRHVIGSINYLFKSLDLIPDGIEDIGFLDDAFVLRVAARLAQASGGQGAVLARLAADATAVNDFLGSADAARLETYVQGLSKGSARGRSVDEVLGAESVRIGLLGDVSSWVASYDPPTFTRDERTLVKLRAFLDTRLPR